jgi:hypothetical protein
MRAYSGRGGVPFATTVKIGAQTSRARLLRDALTQELMGFDQAPPRRHSGTSIVCRSMSPKQKAAACPGLRRPIRRDDVPLAVRRAEVR